MRKKIVYPVCFIGVLLIMLFAYMYFLAAPSNVRISNVTSSGAIFSWHSKYPVPSRLICRGGDGSTHVVSDNGLTTMHYVEISDLVGSHYDCKIGNGLFLFDSIKLALYPLSEDLLFPAFLMGQVSCQDDSCFDDAHVFIQLDGYALMSVPVNESGNWSVDFSSTRRLSDLKQEQFIEGDTLDDIAIWVEAGKWGSSEIYTKPAIVNDVYPEVIYISK